MTWVVTLKEPMKGIRHTVFAFEKESYAYAAVDRLIEAGATGTSMEHAGEWIDLPMCSCEVEDDGDGESGPHLTITEPNPDCAFASHREAARS